MKETKRIAGIIIIRHYVNPNIDLDTAKKHALVTIDNIINANPHSNPLNTEVVSTMDFWKEVREEVKIYKHNNLL